MVKNIHFRRHAGWLGLAALSLMTVTACRPAKSADHAAASASKNPVSLTLEGGTLINPDSARIPDATVVIKDDRIVCAGPAAQCPPPAGTRSVNVRGAFVGPGLIDAHVHYSQTGWVDGRPDAIDLRTQYPYDSVIKDLARHPELFHRADLQRRDQCVRRGGLPLDVRRRAKQP